MVCYASGFGRSSRSASYPKTDHRRARRSFWYKPFVAPTKDYVRWDELMRHCAEHLVSRDGIEEISQWDFEVWNEPNLKFWTGDPGGHLFSVV